MVIDSGTADGCCAGGLIPDLAMTSQDSRHPSQRNSHYRGNTRAEHRPRARAAATRGQIVPHDLIAYPLEPLLLFLVVKPATAPMKTPAIPGVMVRLKQSTAPMHDTLENLPAMRRLVDPALTRADYHALLLRFHRANVACEHHLLRRASVWEDRGYDWPTGSSRPPGWRPTSGTSIPPSRPRPSYLTPASPPMRARAWPGPPVASMSWRARPWGRG